MTCKEHVRHQWKSGTVWKTSFLTKDDEIWNKVERFHPTYLPLDMLTLWICENLVGKYSDKSVERPEWVRGREAEYKFIKRIAKVYEWYGKDKDAREVDGALVTLFVGDSKEEDHGQLTFIKSKKSKRKISSKITPQP